MGLLEIKDSALAAMGLSRRTSVVGVVKLDTCAGAVLAALLQFKGVPASQKSLSNHTGVWRISARLTDIKRAGYAIKSAWAKGENRRGRMVRYKVYWI